MMRPCRCARATLALQRQWQQQQLRLAAAAFVLTWSARYARHAQHIAVAAAAAATLTSSALTTNGMMQKPTRLLLCPDMCVSLRRDLMAHPSACSSGD